MQHGRIRAMQHEAGERVEEGEGGFYRGQKAATRQGAATMPRSGCRLNRKQISLNGGQSIAW